MMRRFTWMALAAVMILPGSVNEASELDAEYRAKIEELLVLTGAKDIGKQMGAGILQQMIAGMKQADPTMPERAFDLVEEVVNEFIESESDALFEELIPLYAKYYTEEDLDVLLTFYRTPTGRKVISTMPAILQESMQIGGNWARERIPALQRELRERLVAEGFLDPGE